MGEVVQLREVLEDQANTMTSSSPDALRYVCPSCGRTIDPVGLTVFGRTTYVRGTCPCVIEREAQAKARRKEQERQARIARLFDLAELGPRFQECTFESWKPRRGSEASYAVAWDMAANWTAHAADGRGLLLFGDPGNGKSHLAAAIVNHLVPQDISCVFRSVPVLLKRLQAANRPGAKVDESELLSVLRDADLLVLDDIGAEKMTDWAEMTLYVVIDERYRWKKPVVCTTNRDLDDLEEHIGARAFDRLMEMCVLVKNSASSYRREKAAERCSALRS